MTRAPLSPQIAFHRRDAEVAEISADNTLEFSLRFPCALRVSAVNRHPPSPMLPVSP